MDMNLNKLREIGEDRGAWCTTVHAVTKSQTCLSDRTTPCYSTEENIKISKDYPGMTPFYTVVLGTVAVYLCVLSLPHNCTLPAHGRLDRHGHEPPRPHNYLFWL